MFRRFEDFERLTEHSDKFDEALHRGFRPGGDSPFQGDVVEKEKLASAFDKLESTGTGRPITDAIRDHDTTVKFGETDEGNIAQFDSSSNEITVHEDLNNANPEILAAHMAHEGIHVQWNEPDSINQEYHAFKAQAEVWDETKGNLVDYQCDFVSKMLSRGEAEAKSVIRQMYPDLPEHYQSV